MLKVGITGGIGSGKTTVCKIFETFGIPIYDSDKAAKWLMQNDENLIKTIKEIFGDDIYTLENKLDRKKLAAIVFYDKKALKKLEELVHPAVFRYGEKWLKQHKTKPYIIKEAALLFESGSYRQLDYVITITAPEKVRIARVQKRDGATVADIKARIDKQMPESEKVKLSDAVIENNEEKMLIPQIIEIHKILLEKSKLKKLS
ncbi:MAG: dephospho-CoA kinase [Chitinophagales bacterium]